LNSSTAKPNPKRRDKLNIIAQILEIAKDETLKTQIMYKANLSFAQLNDYLKFMLKINLLQKLEDNKKEIYKTTEKGMDFLQRHQKISELLTTESESPLKSITIPPENLIKKK
jgi:predicted transcriptional regulator